MRDSIVDADPFCERCRVTEIATELIQIKSAFFREIVVALVAMGIEKCSELRRWRFFSRHRNAANACAEGNKESGDGENCFQLRIVKRMAEKS